MQKLTQILCHGSALRCLAHARAQLVRRETASYKDSKPATASYKDFIAGETRYSRLVRSFPDRAADLFDKAEKRAAERYEQLAERAKGE